MNPSGNDCDGLEVGAFYFLSVNAWPTLMDADGNYLRPTERQGEVVLFGWQDIPPGVDLYLTDRAWSEFRRSFVDNTVHGDGIVGITSPSDRGFPAGLAFGMGNNTLLRDNHGLDWTDIDVESTSVNTRQYFQLDTDGDQVFFYCRGSDGRDRPLAGLSYNGPFLRYLDDDGTHDYGTNTSAAPEAFYRNAPEELNSTDPTPGMLVMNTPGTDGTGRRCSYWEFRCPGGGDASCKMDFYSLRNAVQDAESNWYGSNPDGSVCLPSAAAPPMSPHRHWTSPGGPGAWSLLLLLLWFLGMV